MIKIPKNDLGYVGNSIKVKILIVKVSQKYVKNAKTNKFKRVLK